jgi:phosphoribosyl 1,2-cyclic phosphodiesterase
MNDELRASLTTIGGGFDITFHGVRGSTPCNGDEIARYGGNTSCVSVDVPGHDPVLFDLGTGLRYFGLGVDTTQPFRGTCLLSHLHWDHVQGLPFFSALLSPDARLHVVAPVQDDGRTVGEVVGSCLCPPVFPIGLADLPGSVSFEQVADDDFMLGEIEVSARLIPHLGNTCGYRLTWRGASVAYLSDHQQPGIGDHSISAGARALCTGADVLIHDAQYTSEEFARKSTWGHCSVEYAAAVATECGVGTLVLFHHDPLHDDDQIDVLERHVAGLCADSGITVVAARERSTLHVGPSNSR